MKQSSEINEIATALAKAQSEMSGAKKTSKNPFFKSTYSDLAEVIETIKEPFRNNGLAFLQSVKTKDNKISVKTRIIHTSGQWIESSSCELPPTKQDPQSYGSAITYAKRYSLQSFVGLASVDDDGNYSSNKVIMNNDEIVKKIGETKSIEELATLWLTLDKEQQIAHLQNKELKKEMLINQQKKGE